MIESDIIAVIDTNCIIGFFKGNYQPEDRNSFFDRLKMLIEAQKVLLIKPVKDELTNVSKKDEIAQWISEIDKEAIIYPGNDLEIVLNVQKIMNHVNDSPYYKRSSFDIWLDKIADPNIIATAMKYHCTVFTLEGKKKSRDANEPSGREPKITNICEDFGVRVIDLETFLQLTGLSLKKNS